ncbi:MAG TPA: DmsE family decaheme c-type cytochrome [Candidatus Limnocylindrales bacterium]|nr:DmsE family decaheme c-type cytochrome [Candidatus Limnocylindrales bacterium]
MDKGLLLRSRMSSGHWLYPSFVSLSLLLVFVSAAPFALSGDKKPTKDTKGASQTKYVRPTDPAQYVGVETCKTCHDEISKGFENTPHFATSMAAKLDAHAGPEWQGCEACHGPGKAHVDGGGDKTKIFTFKDASPVQISARCLDCHANSHEQNNFGRSAHLQSGVSCIDCHSPHHARESEFLLKESAPKLCYACHLDVRAEFARPFHHRVNEGLVQCADCHNAHGGFLAHQLRRADGYDEVCYKCHAEKQGPFVYQHEAKIEGCTVCHSPHGSTNQRMLKLNQVNLLCISCHSQAATAGPPGTPSFHDQSTKYQACTLCHVAVHGSNTSPVFFTP